MVFTPSPDILKRDRCLHFGHIMYLWFHKRIASTAMPGMKEYSNSFPHFEHLRSTLGVQSLAAFFVLPSGFFIFRPGKIFDIAFWFIEPS